MTPKNTKGRSTPLPFPLTVVSLFFMLWIATGCAAEIQTPTSAEGVQLVILTPQEGQVLPTQKQAVIEARFEPPVDLEATVIEADVVAVRDEQRIVIAKGDLRPFESPDRLRAFWNVAEVLPGEYVINVKVAGPHRGEASVRVTVHPAPAVTMRLVSLRRIAQGAEAVFSVAATSPAKVPIREYIWTAGDGTPPQRTDEPTFTHVYRELDRTYVVWVEVNDARGGSTLIARDLKTPPDLPKEGLKIPREVFHETHDCGCRRMTIRAAGGNTNIHCAAAVPDRPGCAAVAAPPGTCPAGQVPYQCPLGEITPAPPGQPRLGWLFEIVADLTVSDLVPTTNDLSQCTQGQYARGTRIRDGAIRPNPQALANPPAGAHNLPDGTAGAGGFNFISVGPPNPYPPFGGPNYGGDGFTQPDDLKRHRPTQFYWNDAPRGRVGTISYTSDNEFISFVQGNLGTCWCRFWLRQSWTARGGTQGPGIVLVDGLNCRVVTRPPGLF